jgi:hypothetical protein
MQTNLINTHVSQNQVLTQAPQEVPLQEQVTPLQRIVLHLLLTSTHPYNSVLKPTSMLCTHLLIQVLSVYLILCTFPNPVPTSVRT